MTKHCSKKEHHKSNFKLPLYLGLEGPNLKFSAPVAEGETIATLCRAFDENFTMVGTQGGVIQEDGNIRVEFALNDGSKLTFVVPPDVPFPLTGPIDAAFARAFPVTTPYIGNPAYGFLNGDNTTNKGDPNVISWAGTGVFKNATMVVAKCLYLTYNGEVVECLDCMFWIFNQPLM